MFHCMDQVDNAYVTALFPTYLLEQPIGHDLWKIYYKNRKLFRKLKAKGETSPTLREPRLRQLRSDLSYEARKEIWEKLMSIGVLGTIPYDAVSDEYLVQVYQYFYPDIDRGSPPRPMSHVTTDDMQVDSDSTDITQPVASSLSTRMGLRINHGAEDEDDDDDDDDDVDEDDDDDEDGDDDVDGGNNNDDDDDDVDDDDDDDADYNDNDDANTDGNAEGNDGFEDNGVGRSELRIQTEYVDQEAGHEAHGENESIVSQNLAEGAGPQNPTAVPAQVLEVKSSKDLSDPPSASSQVHFKKNAVSREIYKQLGYPLPQAWETPSNNSILVSSDGCTQLKPNPEFQALSAHDRRTGPLGGPGLSESLSTFNSRQEYVSTTANNTLHSKSLALFYYEIRVLWSRSYGTATPSRIKVGFKDLSKIQSSSKSSSRTDLQSSDPVSINRQSASIVRASLESGSSSSSSNRGETLSKGSFVYGGQDGNITDGTLSKSYSNGYGPSDVVGCGINYVSGTIFFTKNGVHLGTAFTDVHDIDVVPFISLAPGAVVRTNFGLHEEFVYDILGYQRMLKARAYQHIYKSIDGHDGRNDFESSFYDDQNDELEDNELNLSSHDESFRNKDGFLLQNDDRFSGDQLYRPEVEKLNNLNTDDDSIPCTMNTMINDYLIHEGLIDVAKGFLIDLNKDCIPDNEEERARIVIRHNERQIVKEENNLKVRQDIRRLVNESKVTACIAFIDAHYPGLLKESIDLLFELKLAEYLVTLVNFKDHPIEEILRKGQELTAEFVYNSDVPLEYKEGFQSHLNDISSLLAYDNPLEECSEDLAVYLTPAYLQDRLFQLINSRILLFLKKRSESSLENMVSYTRAMVNALMEYGEGSSLVHNDSELRVHKLVNIDEDLLNI
ncbi:LADA_0G15720g1_1 [Lachancea dasiensis]|uniref:LADA_0G15720g1_1 n=1 Tax=Lachancea dasiensis TaxID=1072105 RepID=A0A1G4JWL1_9SACH|nr:LADA_0G15720g1_1 [Lachancea dasiensis]